MSTEEDYLLRPVFHGMTSLSSLTDGTINLELIAMANEYIDVRNENEFRISEAMKPTD